MNSIGTSPQTNLSANTTGTFALEALDLNSLSTPALIRLQEQIVQIDAERRASTLDKLVETVKNEVKTVHATSDLKLNAQSALLVLAVVLGPVNAELSGVASRYKGESRDNLNKLIGFTEGYFGRMFELNNYQIDDRGEVATGAVNSRDWYYDQISKFGIGKAAVDFIIANQEKMPTAWGEIGKRATN